MDIGSGTTLFRSATNVANGNTLDREGRLITCEAKSGRLIRTEGDGFDESAGELLQTEKQFNGPNDVVVKSDRSNLVH
jgi:gluconolactonase